MGYSTHAVRIVLDASSIRSTLYKLKLQFHKKYPETAVANVAVSRQEKRRLFRRSYRAIFQRAPATPSTHFRARKKKKAEKTSPLLSLQKKRRATKVERARVKSRRFSLGGMRVDLRGGCVPETVDRSKLYTITNPTRNYHVTSLAHCASGNVKD